MWQHLHHTYRRAFGLREAENVGDVSAPNCVSNFKLLIFFCDFTCFMVMVCFALYFFCMFLGLLVKLISFVVLRCDGVFKGAT